jgi:pimeloyl-ACP methyl ester carboxylesterase
VLLHSARGPLEVLDTGQGAVLLALHGAMGGYDQSDLLARTVVAGGYRVLAVSRPGYLGTPMHGGRTPEEQADLFAAALDTLGIERVAVIAVSGGGPSALQFAARHPQRCSALVLISTCSGPITERIPAAFYVMKTLVRLPWFAKALERRAAQRLDGAARRAIRDPLLRERTLAHPDAGPLFRQLLQSTTNRVSHRLRGTDNDIAVTRIAEYPLERILAPCLIVHGTADRVVAFEHARRAAKRIRGAELFSIEGGEHVSIFTHLEAVRGRVMAFLRAHLDAVQVGTSQSPTGRDAAGT